MVRSKPLRPFPFPLNIGTDICQISRIYNILKGRHRHRFLRRLLPPEELSRCRGRLDWAEQSGLAREETGLWRTATFVAGRFAAKEAAIKAHTQRRLHFHDIVVINGGPIRPQGTDAPTLRIKAIPEADEDMTAPVSISHDGDYATAVCMAVDE